MRTFQLTEEEITDLSSLLTYCRNTNPSYELKSFAQELLTKMYTLSLFDTDTIDKLSNKKEP